MVEEKGKMGMVLWLVIVPMIVRAEVFATVVDVHKSFLSSWSNGVFRFLLCLR